MAAERFIILDRNPNDDTGGGGCLCSNEKVTDCVGPFVVFNATDMDSPISPHQVIGCRCLARASERIKGEALGSGHEDITPQERKAQADRVREVEV